MWNTIRCIQSISYDINQYTTGTSTKLYLMYEIYMQMYEQLWDQGIYLFLVSS